MLETTTTKGVAMVTGGSGYLSSWIIVDLLRRGYSVRTTIRSLERELDVRHAIATQADPAGRLQFFAADLLSDEGWDQAAEGAQFVLHVAAPMPVGEFKGQDLIKPTREGTLRVLKAALKAGAQHVVMTSSVQTALPAHGPNDGPATDESIWTDLSMKGVNDYTRAKTLAEQDAWAFARQAGSTMTLTTVLPAFIQGPVMTKDFSGSLELVARMLKGQVPAIPRVGFSIVDTRDLVDLHLKAMTMPEARGERFIASSNFLWFAEIAAILREQFGAGRKLPTKMAPDLVIRFAALFSDEARQLAPNIGKRRAFCSAKAERLLGWRKVSAAESITACAESLIQHKLV